MGDDIADSVTNDFGRIHDTTNCYVASPAQFPHYLVTEPMLTGVALCRRTGDPTNLSVLPGPRTPCSAPNPKPASSVFDGTDATFKNWRIAGLAGGGVLHVNGEMVSYGDKGCGSATTRPRLRRLHVATAVQGLRRQRPQQRGVRSIFGPTLDLATDEPAALP